MRTLAKKVDQALDKPHSPGLWFCDMVCHKSEVCSGAFVDIGMRPLPLSYTTRAALPEGRSHQLTLFIVVDEPTVSGRSAKAARGRGQKEESREDEIGIQIAPRSAFFQQKKHCPLLREQPWDVGCAGARKLHQAVKFLTATQNPKGDQPLGSSRKWPGKDRLCSGPTPAPARLISAIEACVRKESDR